MQSATFADAPGEVRRLIRRRQRSGDVAVLDQVQFGRLVSRVAKLHPAGGTWTLSRALGEAASALQALEAKKTMAGRDFGELVRERRRQRGLPLPVAEKVLPFRCTAVEPVPNDVPTSEESVNYDTEQHWGDLMEDSIAEAWCRLSEAEGREASPAELSTLEGDYLREMRTFAAAGTTESR